IVRIDYSTNNGTSWNLITSSTPASTGTYNWNIPSNLSTDQAKIRISDAATGLNLAVISNTFSISSLRLISPNGGEAYPSGSSQNITWSSSSTISNILIELSSDGGLNWSTIASNVLASAGTYSWSIPSNLSTSQALIRLTDQNNPNFRTQSANTFKVGSIVVLTPNGGERVLGNNTYQITWNSSSSISLVNIDYSTNNGVSWNNAANSIPAGNGAYDWYVPGIATTNGKIRIYDTYGANIIDQSDNVFTIATMQVTSPNGGEGFLVGSIQPISWTTSSVTNINIEYSTNNGGSWVSIVTNVLSSTGSYNWTIPNVPTSQALVRIVDASEPTYFDASDNVFKIGNLQVVSPNGSEIFQSGKPYTITWSNTSNITQLNIELSSNNGVDWIPVAGAVDATPGSYTWTVNNTPTNQALIRLTDAANANLFDISNNVFSIKSLQLLSPNGGEFYQVDSIRQITWNSSNINNVKIEYSTNSGSDWITITASTPAAPQTYAWTIPNTPTFNGLVRISDSDNPGANVFDLSDNIFYINALVISSPNGGEVLPVASVQNIKWLSHPSIANVKLEYTTNNGTSWNLISASTPAAAQQYSWNIPIAPTTSARIRITDVDNPDVTDQSDNVFTIRTLRLTSPNGNEKLQSGKTHAITWLNISSVSTVDLEYTTNNGSSWTSIVSGLDATLETYNWVVPANTTFQAKVRIKSSTNSLIIDESDNLFTIASLAATSPNGGENIQVGTTLPVTWSSSNINAVNISYSVDNGTSWINIVNSYPASSGVYNWGVPNSPTSLGLIRVRDASVPTIEDISNNVFSILLLQLTSPIGGEGWTIGASKNITWNSNGISSIKIEYSTNGGTNWDLIQGTHPANTGSYSWTIPNAPSSQVKVKISDASIPAIKDSTAGNFTIGKITLLAPVTGNHWQAGSTKEIQWNATTGINNVKIEYSTNSGSSWNTITNSTNAALGTYSWSIPGTISTTTAQVRVSHSSTGLAIYDTTGLFTISNLQVTSPNGGEYWQAGTNKNITWSSSVSTNIKIDYSTDNGSNWNTIIASTPAVAGTYSWSIPSNLSSSNARIRISDVSNSSIFDVSDNSFKIGSINIIDPVAGNIWQAGTTQQIRWNASSSISNVRIDYSEDDGLNWVNIILSTSAVTGSYNWSIPGSLSSTTTRIRVSDAQSSLNILSISDAFSTMSLSLTSPNGGEKWQAGTSKNITWNASTTISNVKLEYSLDNGSTWTTIIASIAASNGTYAWSIPSGISSNQALIKISDVANSSIFDLSNNTFTINRIQITSPVTADQWQAGTTKNITWSSANINSLKIEYSTNGGTNWISIVSSVAGSLGSYSWDIPSNVTTTQAKIRISDVSDAAVNDSSGLFRISILQLTSPNGGEQWQAGTTRTINWTSSNVSNVQLEYTTNNGTNWNTIVASTPAAGGSYNWLIPPNLTTSNARIRVSDAANSSINDFSDNTFTISNLVLTSPNGGEQWQAGSIKNITWSGNASISEVKLEYSLNAGSSWTVIQNAVTASLGTYAWTIPSNISSNQARIRVSSVANPLITNQSADFTISRLELTSPTGGEYWQTGTNKNITWVTGQVTNIKIEYSTNGGSSWNSIINSVAAASGTYSWVIPAGLSSSTAKIKISDVSNSSIKDSSASTFVLGTVAVTSPNGGEEFQAGTTQPITWTAATSVQNVRIDYSTNNGTSWNSIVSSTLASAGTYNWSIPTNISSANCLIRISDAASSLQILDVSDNVFSINSLMLLSPNGGEYLQVGITKAIQWSSANITLVKLEYTTNNGTDWNLIANNVTANTLSYNWVIPNTPSNNVKVRISDAANSAIRDVSDSTFVIANVTVLSPNGGERWQSGSAKQITWSNTSNVSLVNLYYSTNNGTSWNSIVLNQTASTGSYNWTVPATPSQQTLVKVVDANSSGAISDSSDAVFTISSLSIVAPIGGENWLGGSTQAIRWTNSSDVNLVDIYYSTNNGTSWTSIVTNQSTVGGQYNWSVPVNINTSTAKVKIEYSTDVTVSASSGTFSIYYPNLVLTAPNGGEFIQAGTNTNITWNSTIIANVKLDYSLDGGTSWTTIVASHPSTPASYTWLVPDNLSSTNALVRISDASNASVFDVSDFGFKIGWIDLTSPNGGENWQSGTTKNITWSNSGSVSNIKIELSTNGGTNWSTITASTPAAAGTYGWVVINSPTDEALIRLSDAASSSAIKDQSTNQFSISSLALVYPAGGNDLQAGSS
ncbi:MAG: hypothetical protein PHW28_05975, partial [Mesotoga sp.]|nr:hypothetical protein [Mesotoga sp.]